ncbi:hypothetical protein DFP72DRAFT_135776 [Ephemerocybe angulata]|uniref:Uncharacterized protein n=1 Tax=Ephemerocybe angulata TaxID=980116 RepID=A0A8H6MCY7_9AGAR|nr:hypothetical protein DFP72DRAFT_135776 [Tulosesus angulatus]
MNRCMGARLQYPEEPWYASARPSGRYHQNPFYTFPTQILPFEDNSPLYRRGATRGPPSVYDAAGYGGRDPYRAGNARRRQQVPDDLTFDNIAPTGTEPPQAVYAPYAPQYQSAPQAHSSAPAAYPHYAPSQQLPPMQQVRPVPMYLSTNRLLNRTPGVLQLPIPRSRLHNSYQRMRQVLQALIIQGPESKQLQGHHLEHRAPSDALALGAGLATTANHPQAQRLVLPH